MIVTIHQPNYLPYLGFFDKMDDADVFVIYDSTQYKTDDWQNRNKIRTKDGWVWLTVPVSYSFGENINKVKIANSRMLKKHWKSFEAYYSKAPFFKEYSERFREIYEKDWELLCDLNVALIRKCAEALGIKTRIVLASEIIDLKSKGPEALYDICKELGATKYISGKDGKKYFGNNGIKKFEDAGIELEYQDYKHPEYRQSFSGFEPYMCILDLIFNHGPKSLDILKNRK